ncbi:nucleic acid-binding, OB-fold protein [Tanacetum coccineum]
MHFLSIKCRRTASSTLCTLQPVHSNADTGMTIKITPLQEITPDKGKIKIKVKVLSLWNQYYSNNSSKLSRIDMILMDEQDEKITSYPHDLDSIVNRVFMFKLQVSTYNVNNNYHIFTVNKLTDDKDVIKSILSKQTKEEESKSHTLEKVSAEGDSRRNNAESHEKSPKDEHQDTKERTLNLEHENSAVGGIKRKNLEPENSDMEKKTKAEHEDTKQQVQ